MGDERQRGDARVEQLAALLELELASGFGEVARDIAHGDRALERRRETTAGDPAELIAFAIEDQRTFAHGLSAVDVEADALLGWPILQLRENPERTREAAFRAAALVDREVEAGHDRRRLAVDIVAVQRQPSLKAQRIARAEPDRPGGVVSHDRIGKLGRASSGHGNLESVLASIAGAA